MNGEHSGGFKTPALQVINELQTHAPNDASVTKMKYVIDCTKLMAKSKTTYTDESGIADSEYKVLNTYGFFWGRFPLF